MLYGSLEARKVVLCNIYYKPESASMHEEWNKYATNVRLTKNLKDDPYDVLFDRLQQYEGLVNASRAKRTAKTHDPLALVANTYANSSSSRSPPAYYVTHTPSVIGYNNNYQGEELCDDQEDSLTTAMMLLAHAITQRYFAPTNNRLRTSSYTRNQAVVQAGREDIQSRNVRNGGRNVRRTADNQGDDADNSRNASNVQCYNCIVKGHYARDCLKPRVRDSKYFLKQTLLAKKDEVGIILTTEHNDFLLLDASEIEEFEDLSTMVFIMARIQQAGSDSGNRPVYTSEFISEASNPSTSFINPLYSQNYHEKTCHEQHKIIKLTLGNDQINSDIIFDDPKVEVNNEKVEQDKNAHD
nr:hypothetical protein [Tanacetum cinerariifolium]